MGGGGGDVLGDGLLVDLEDVDGHAAGGGELLVADVALEVLGLLVLHEDLLVVELAVAVVTEHLLHALLLLPHHARFPLVPLPLLSRGRSTILGLGFRRGEGTSAAGGRRRRRRGGSLLWCRIGRLACGVQWIFVSSPLEFVGFSIFPLRRTCWSWLGLQFV